MAPIDYQMHGCHKYSVSTESNEVKLNETRYAYMPTCLLCNNLHIFLQGKKGTRDGQTFPLSFFQEDQKVERATQTTRPRL